MSAFTNSPISTNPHLTSIDIPSAGLDSLFVTTEDDFKIRINNNRDLKFILKSEPTSSTVTTTPSQSCGLQIRTFVRTPDEEEDDLNFYLCLIDPQQNEQQQQLHYIAVRDIAIHAVSRTEDGSVPEPYLYAQICCEDYEPTFSDEGEDTGVSELYFFPSTPGDAEAIQLLFTSLSEAAELTPPEEDAAGGSAFSSMLSMMGVAKDETAEYPDGFFSASNIGDFESGVEGHSVEDYGEMEAYNVEDGAAAEGQFDDLEEEDGNSSDGATPEERQEMLDKLDSLIH
jgi:hypothetical protein